MSAPHDARRRTRPRGRLAAVAALAIAASATATPLGGAPASASYLGRQIPLSQAPWIVTLTPVDEHDRAAKTLPGHALRCSGAAIGPDRVLMASHCFNGVDPGRLGIRVGSDDLLANLGRTIPIARAWSPLVGVRDFANLNGIDTIVLQTKRPLGVPTLPIATVRPLPGEAVTSFGFGDDRPGDSPDVPRPFLRRWDGSVLSGCPPMSDQLMICAASPDNGGTRPGDSGGPLVAIRNGAPEIVGDTVMEVLNGRQRVSGFADVAALHDFVLAPPRSAEVSFVSRAAKIVGDVRPGGRVTCQVGFAPKPRAIDYRWHVGGRPGEHDAVYFDRHGARLHAFAGGDIALQQRSMVLPRNAAGKRLECYAEAFQGPYRTGAVAVVPRIRKAP